MASTSITFQVIYGAHSESKPVCYLLEVDDLTILLDCGWDEEFDEALLEPLSRVVRRVDAVLLSHSDISHIGALPYAVAKLGLTAPIFGTPALYKMAQMTLYDSYQAHQKAHDCPPFDLNDVDAAFSDNVSFTELVFREQRKLDGTDVKITPYCAGHTLGGAFWKITKEKDEIIYAANWNHKAEFHLNASELMTFKRPMLLVAPAHNALLEQAKRKHRDKELLARLTETLRGGGNVLMPIDAAGRVLEMLLKLVQHWHNTPGMNAYKLALLTHTSIPTLEFAKSQLPSCSDEINKRFSADRVNPFDDVNGYVKLISSMEELDRLAAMGNVAVLASSPTMDCGTFSHELLRRWAPGNRNLVLATQRAVPGTIAHALLHGQRELRYTHVRRVELEGAELEAALLAQQKQRGQAGEVAAAEAAPQPPPGKGSGPLLAPAGEGEGMDVDSGAGVSDAANDAGVGGALGQLPSASSAAGADGAGGTTSTTAATAMTLDADSDDDEAVGTGGRRSGSGGSGGFGGGGIFGTPRFPMFALPPQLEKPPLRTLYGEDIVPEKYMDQHARARAAAKVMSRTAGAKGAGAGAGAAGGQRVGLNFAVAGDKEMHGGGAAPTPTKVIRSPATLRVQCQVAYVDLEGQADGKSTKNMLFHVEPRKLILVNGSAPETGDLVSFAKTKLASTCANVYAPVEGDAAIDMESDTSIYKTTMDEALMIDAENMRQRINDYDISYIDAEMQVAGGSTTLKPLGWEADGTDVEAGVQSTGATAGGGEPAGGGEGGGDAVDAGTGGGRSATLLSELPFRLPEFKNVLAKAGHDSELRNAVLYCRDGVSVRKATAATGGGDRLVVEGPLCDVYYEVRDLLYEQFVIL